MITQYRSAYNNFYKAPTFSGRSIDTKPVNVENGAVYKEIDTAGYIVTMPKTTTGTKAR